MNATAQEILTALDDLLAAGKWGEAEQLVRDADLDTIQMTKRHNPAPSQDWRKGIDTTTEFYLLGNLFIAQAETISTYGSADRRRFEFDPFQ